MGLAGRSRRITVISIVAALASAVGASTTVFGGAPPESGSGLQAWGHGVNGQLGDGELGEKGLPVAVKNLSCVRSVALSELNSFAVLANGHVDAWGADSGTATGELGDGGADEPYSAIPVEIPGIAGAKQIAADTPDVYVVLTNGTITGWGDNRDGQFGNEKLPEGSTTPLAGIGGFTEGVQAVATERSAVLALLASGEVEAWGFNENGQLGDDKEGFSEPKPAAVRNATNSGPLKEIKAIAIGSSFGDALTNNGEVLAWGGNSVSGLGAGISHSLLPVKVKNPAGTEPLKEVEAISGGADHMLALLKDGKVVAWGAGLLGQLGDGKEETPATYLPVEVKGLTEVVAIAATESDGYALRKDGTVWAWGNNTEEQLGVNSKAHAIDEPVEISALGNEITALGSGAGAQDEMALGAVASCGSEVTTSTTSTSSATSTTSTTQTTTSIPVTTSTTSSATSTGTGNPNEPIGKGGSFRPGETSGANTPATGAVLASDLGLPLAKACFSHRSFAIHVHQPAGYPKILSAEVFLGHKREGTVQGKRITSQVNLHGLPAGTFTIVIRAHLEGGRTITGTRTYHTCAKHRLKGHHHRL